MQKAASLPVDIVEHRYFRCEHPLPRDDSPMKFIVGCQPSTPAQALGVEMLLGLRQPDLVAKSNGKRSVTIAMLPSFTKGGPPISLTSLQTPVGQHLLTQLASFTKGRPTSIVVFNSLQLSSNQDLGMGGAICPFKSPLPREYPNPAGDRAVFHERHFQSRAARAACMYGRRAY